MTARNILNDPPTSRSYGKIADGGGALVLFLTLILFVAPMTIWALGASGSPSNTSAVFETRMLLLSALLALILSLIQIYLQIRQFGGPAVRSNRARLVSGHGAAGRVARAHRNLIENFVPFSIVVVAACVIGISTPWTVAAAATFFGSRLIHAISYTVGVTIVRSAAFYAGAIATIIIVISDLLYQ